MVETGAAARIARQVPAALAALLLGLVVGVLGAFQHSQDLEVAGVDLPVGVVGGLAALVLAELLARAALPAAGPALVLLGWLVAVVVLGTTRTEGDLAIPAGAAGETFLYGGFVLGLLTAMGLALQKRRS